MSKCYFQGSQGLGTPQHISQYYNSSMLKTSDNAMRKATMRRMKASVTMSNQFDQQRSSGSSLVKRDMAQELIRRIR